MNGSTKRITLGAAAILVTWSLTIIGAVWAASANLAVIVGRVDGNQVRVDDHETRLRALELQMQQVANDVRWIRLTMEREHQP